MYFITVSLKKKKPNTGLFRNRVMLINGKTKEVTSFQLGKIVEWEYYMARGYTHWIKSISKKQLLKQMGLIIKDQELKQGLDAHSRYRYRNL